jgi:hypothetical protein
VPPTSRKVVPLSRSAPIRSASGERACNRFSFEAHQRRADRHDDAAHVERIHPALHDRECAVIEGRVVPRNPRHDELGDAVPEWEGVNQMLDPSGVLGLHHLHGILDRLDANGVLGAGRSGQGAQGGQGAQP